MTTLTLYSDWPATLSDATAAAATRPIIRRAAFPPPRITAMTPRLADVVRGHTAGCLSDEQITYAERGNILGAQCYAAAASTHEPPRRQGRVHELPTDWALKDIGDRGRHSETIFQSKQSSEREK